MYYNCKLPTAYGASDSLFFGYHEARPEEESNFLVLSCGVASCTCATAVTSVDCEPEMGEERLEAVRAVRGTHEPARNPALAGQVKSAQIQAIFKGKSPASFCDETGRNSKHSTLPGTLSLGLKNLNLAQAPWRTLALRRFSSPLPTGTLPDH